MRVQALGRGWLATTKESLWVEVEIRSRDCRNQTLTRGLGRVAARCGAGRVHCPSGSKIKAVYTAACWAEGFG